MPNPYTDLFEQPERLPEPPPAPSAPAEARDLPPVSPGEMTEPLDAILQKLEAFRADGDRFSEFLSQTRAVDHREEANSESFLRTLFFVTELNHSKGSLEAEKTHYQLMHKKFRGIVEGMKTLAFAHLEIVRDFNLNIDKHYYSIEKNQFQVNKDIEFAVNAINTQRRILGEAARDLDILEKAMQATEGRLENRVDEGGPDNLSAAEFHMLRHNRRTLTDGKEHQFDCSFFDLNLVDRVALHFDVYLKKTVAQYFNQLSTALDAKERAG